MYAKRLIWNLDAYAVVSKILALYIHRIVELNFEQKTANSLKFQLFNNAGYVTTTKIVLSAYLFAYYLPWSVLINVSLN